MASHLEIPDDASHASAVSHASATYAEVKDLLHGIFRSNNVAAPSDYQNDRSSQQAPAPLEQRRVPRQSNPSTASQRGSQGHGSPSPDKRLLAQRNYQAGGFLDRSQSPARGNDLDRLLAAQAQAQDEQLNLRQEANAYQQQIHLMQTEKEQQALAQFAAQFRDGSITAEALKHQNSQLQRQLTVLTEKMKDIRAKLGRPSLPRQRVIKKKCDHAHTLNRLETHLKSRENEYKAARAELDHKLRNKERELVTSMTALKSARTQSELLRRAKLSTDTSAMGYDKMNELVAKLRVTQSRNEELHTDVKSYHRLNGQQYRELEQIDAAKNYPGKMQSLTQELRSVTGANRDVQQQLAELAQTKKALRAQETRLEDRQRDILNRQRLQKQGAGGAAPYVPASPSDFQSRGRMSPIVARRPPTDLLAPNARRRRELQSMSKEQLLALMVDIETANEEKQKINQKYASQVKEMAGPASAARSHAYDNTDALAGAAAGLGSGPPMGTGLRNYESMPQLEGRHGSTSGVTLRGLERGGFSDDYGEDNTFN